MLRLFGVTGYCHVTQRCHPFHSPSTACLLLSDDAGLLEVILVLGHEAFRSAWNMPVGVVRSASGEVISEVDALVLHLGGKGRLLCRQPVQPVRGPCNYGVDGSRELAA
jgi:hypothetical protein